MCSVSFKHVYLGNYHKAPTHTLLKEFLNNQTSNKEQKVANLQFFPLPFLEVTYLIISFH